EFTRKATPVMTIAPSAALTLLEPSFRHIVQVAAAAPPSSANKIADPIIPSSSSEAAPDEPRYADQKIGSEKHPAHHEAEDPELCSRLGRHAHDDRGEEGEVMPGLRLETLGHREEGDDCAHQQGRHGAEEKGPSLWSHPARPPRERRKASTSARWGSESCAPRFVHARAAAALASGIACSREPPAARPTASAPLKASPAAVESTASTGKDGK